MNVNTTQNDAGVVKGDFKQCTIVREDSTGISSTVTYLPVKFAKIGKVLDVNTNEVWETWVVLKVSDNVLTDPIDPRVLIRAHRRATGDSMPKRKSN